MPRRSTPSNSFYLLVAILSILSCAKNESLTTTDPEDNTLVFETFVLEQKNNPELDEDVIFDIQSNNINGPLKHYYFNAIPTFTTNAESSKFIGKNLHEPLYN